ncbi:hypothetical protein [Candidatus Mycobacterium methanotrophicum]|uniref:Uncharacterized protein n=2 Tax=Candidatus Mycobacterium methanotrophicum TaxID=2943498 RepID=A0ABY4QK93_9MYCO|nr:hypothetical protein [Candidatus Mycobacterium methanotrophicum]UQX11398.1 hypothetical protein M5I08_02425 [Candidatus Mycobacterium methanotrophicum]
MRLHPEWSAMTANYPVDSTTRRCCGGIGAHVRGCPGSGVREPADLELALGELKACRDHLTAALTEARFVSMRLAGRAGRASELLGLIDDAMLHAEQLAVVVQADLHYEDATGEAKL